MHEQNIEILRGEALRLLSLHRDVLADMQSSDGVLTNDPGQTLTRTSAMERDETIKGELAKVEQLEMVVAVIGTMKAGKSTTINAIVGAEIAPSRSEAMTALPTLIRHTPGRKEPLLRFQNTAPLHSLLAQMRLALKAPLQTREYQEFVALPDGRHLVEEVLTEQLSIDSEATGSEAIALLLKRINDLVRLARALALPFPYEEYDEVHEFPVIEVEFHHLPAEAQGGRFTLLDTPGPNEAGQSEHLTAGMRKQLRNSSAILVVTDFGQMNTEADFKIRTELQEVLGGSQDPGRVYVILNKYDQKDSNDTASADELKAKLAQRLSSAEGSKTVQLSPEQVFPVSSRSAFYANRAGRALAVNDLDPDNHAWVKDFAKAAFGTAWDIEDPEDRELLQDRERVQSAINKMFRKSGFEVPLRQVILRGHQFAAISSLGSAAGKLVSHCDDLGNLFDLRSTGLKRDAAALQDDIDALRNDIESVNGLEQDLTHKLDQEMGKLVSSCEKRFSATKAAVAEEVNKVFSNEKESEVSRAKQKERQRVGSGGILDTFTSAVLGFQDKRAGSSVKGIQDKIDRGDVKGQVIEFGDKKDAQALVYSINKAVQDAIDRAQTQFTKQVDEAKDAYRCEAEGHIRSRAEPLFRSIEQRINEVGYDVRLTLPELARVQISPSVDGTVKVSLDKKSRTVREKQGGFFGGAKRLFGSLFSSDWGYDDIEKEFYPVDLKVVNETVLGVLKQWTTEVEGALKAYIANELTEKQHAYFVAMKQTLERMRGDLLVAQKQKAEGKQQQENLISYFGQKKKELGQERQSLHNLCMMVDRIEKAMMQDTAEAA